MTDNNDLYYMRARYYNPEIKRFINQDVIQGSIENGLSLNRYAYTNGNPISYIDPFGLSPLDSEEIQSNETINNRFMYAGETSETTADEMRQQIVDLAIECIGKIEYAHTKFIKLTNSDGSIESGLKLDCSYFTSSLYYTIFDVSGKMGVQYEEVPHISYGGADRQSQMGIEVQNLKNSNGVSINYDTLKLGDLLFFDYQKGDGIYEHVAIYIGDGKYIDVASGGCSINTSKSFSNSSDDIASRKINDLPKWTSKGAYPNEMILTARRLIMDDGTLYIYEE